MNERILSRLEPVRRRQLRREMLRFAAVGLLARLDGRDRAGRGRAGRNRGPNAARSGPRLAFVLAGPALGAAAAARLAAGRPAWRRRRWMTITA